MLNSGPIVFVDWSANTTAKLLAVERRYAFGILIKEIPRIESVVAEVSEYAAVPGVRPAL